LAVGLLKGLRVLQEIIAKYENDSPIRPFVAVQWVVGWGVAQGEV